jgi:hypothetical protein
MEKSRDKCGKFQSFPDVNSLSDWLKCRCPDVNSHSRMQSRGAGNYENNTTLKTSVFVGL